jgi:hypothetical protein
MFEYGPLTPAFLILAVSEVVLGGYVFLRGRSSPINRMFFILALLAATGSVLDLMVASLTSGDQAAWAFRLLIFTMTIEMGVAYRLNTLVSLDSGLINLRFRSPFIPLVVLSIAFLLTLTVGGMVRDQYGWVPDSDLPFTMLAIMLLGYLFIMVMSLMMNWAILKGLKKRQGVIFTFALSFPAFVMVLTMVLVMLGFEAPRIYGWGELVSVAIVAIGILRYELLVPNRVTEATASPSRHVPSLVKGRAYLFESPSSGRMFDSMVHEMREGASALIICRTHPDQLRARYQLTHTPLIWLAQSPGPDRVDPGNLQMLSHMTLEFVRRGPSLIAIEGLEYLLVNNELNKVLKFLGQLRDNVIVEGCMLLVTVDPRTLTDRQRAILEREFESVVE